MGPNDALCLDRRAMDSRDPFGVCGPKAEILTRRYNDHLHTLALLNAKYVL